MTNIVWLRDFGVTLTVFLGCYYSRTIEANFGELRMNLSVLPSTTAAAEKSVLNSLLGKC